MFTLFNILICCYFFYHICLELIKIFDAGGFPPSLVDIKRKFLLGKPPRKYARTLRAFEPRATSHYCKVPGRLTCAIRPFNVNGEKIWQLIVGFKETAESKPSHFCKIAVYADGQIYDS